MTDLSATIDAKVLAEAAAWASRSLPMRPAVPVLSGLLIETTADGDGLILSTFDYETSTRAVVPATVKASGTVLVSGRLLADICKSLPAKPVQLHVDGAKLVLTCGRFKSSVQTMPVEEYPSLPVMPTAVGQVNSREFAQAVAQAGVAASRDEMVAALTGIRVEFESDRLTLLATDRFRMAWRDVPWEAADTVAGAAALVPAKVLMEAAKNLSGGDTITLALTTGDGNSGGIIGLEGKGPGGVLRRTTTRLLDAEFPRAKALFPADPHITARVDRQDLIDAVNRVSLVAERNTAVKVSLDADGLTLDAGEGDDALATELLDALLTGDPIATGYNPIFLTDALKVIDAPVVEFRFTSPQKPAVIVGVGADDDEAADDYKQLLMPRRLLS